MEFRDSISTVRSRCIEVLVFGQSNVGKSSIVKQLREISTDIFGVEDRRKNTIDVKNSNEQINFSEATEFPFPSFQKLAFKVSDAVILTYSVESKDSFDYAISFIEEIKSIRGKDVRIIVAANKSDTEYREVHREAAEYEVTIGLECKHVELCATDGEGMKDLFSCLLGYFGQYLIFPEQNEIIHEKKQPILKRLSTFLQQRLSSRSKKSLSR